MANRNPKTGGTEFSNGEVLYDYDLDDTIAATTYDLKDSDTTGYTHNTATPTLVTTLNVAAADVAKYIELNIMSKHYKYKDNDSSLDGASYYYIRVDIGETGSEVTKKTYIDNVGLNANFAPAYRTNSNIKYYYEPTASEKTNGFNIKIYLYVGGIHTNGVGSATAAIEDVWVMGI